AVVAQLETQVDGMGDFEMAIACHGPMNTARVERRAVVEGQAYEAYTFGARASLPTRYGLAIHGIAVDGRLAMSDLPTRALEPGEKVSLGFPADAVVMIDGGSFRAFAGGAGVEKWTKDLADAELAQPIGAQVAAAPGGSASVSTAAATTTTPTGWTTGAKKLLYIRVNTSDLPGDPIPLTTAQANMTEIAQYYSDVSQTLTSIATTFVPVTLKLPSPATTYQAANNYQQLRLDALAAARAYDTANGATGKYNPDKYDLDIVMHPRIVFPSDYLGIGLVGARGIWINGSTAAATPKHELGHNYGVQHANGWQPTDLTTPIGAGTHAEYADMFDVMGVPSNGGHFNAWFKSYLLWLPTASVQKVTTSGTYRLYRHDAAKSGGVRALTLGQTADRAYWIDVRRQFTANFSQMNGINLRWAMIPSTSTTMSLTGSRLLDMTPASTSGFSDAALQVGQKFVDAALGITITPTAKGGTAPNEYVDVKIDFGATGANRNPVVSVAVSPLAPTARNAVTFTATASDPDGNPLTFRWDFDGVTDTAATKNTVTRTWLKAGSYTAKCTVSDGLGGIATQTVAVTVTDSLANQTLTKGTNADYYYGVASSAAKVVTVGLSGMTASSVNGLTWTSARVASGTPTLYGVASGNGIFVAVGARSATTPPGAAVEVSTDGTTWTKTDPAIAEKLLSVTFGSGMFVAVGDAGRILTSADGKTWTAITSAATKAFRAVAFGSGQFVAVGEAGTIFTSSNGTTWTNATVTTSASLGAVAFGNGVFVASGQFETWTAPDAKTWTKTLQGASFSTSTTGGPGTLTWTGSVFVSGSAAGTIYFSTDGKTWGSYANATAATVAFQAVGAFGGNAVVTGWDGAAGWFMRTGGTTQTAK
ncbi:MAG: hypothetical protein RLZZ15_1567, partial [Verrucomicrobiota bacterium]